MHVCARLYDWMPVFASLVHLYVCYCWCCCRNILWSELCDMLPCCWIRWQAECISSARRCHSVFCRLSATSALSLYSDRSHGLTSEFGSPSAILRYVGSNFFSRRKIERRGGSFKQIWMSKSSRGEIPLNEKRRCTWTVLCYSYLKIIVVSFIIKRGKWKVRSQMSGRRGDVELYVHEVFSPSPSSLVHSYPFHQASVYLFIFYGK